MIDFKIEDNILKRAYIPKGVTLIEIPDGITEIGFAAFANQSELVNVRIPNGVKNIGKQAFSCCFNLTNINIPDSVCRIEELAFKDCHCLTDITIPNSVIHIGKWAFVGCCGLKNVVLPKHLKEIVIEGFRTKQSPDKIHVSESMCKNLSCKSLEEQLKSFRLLHVTDSSDGRHRESLELRKDDKYRILTIDEIKAFHTLILQDGVIVGIIINDKDRFYNSIGKSPIFYNCIGDYIYGIERYSSDYYGFIVHAEWYIFEYLDE